MGKCKDDRQPPHAEFSPGAGEFAPAEAGQGGGLERVMAGQTGGAFGGGGGRGKADWA